MKHKTALSRFYPNQYSRMYVLVDSLLVRNSSDLADGKEARPYEDFGELRGATGLEIVSLSGMYCVIKNSNFFFYLCQLFPVLSQLASELTFLINESNAKAPYSYCRSRRKS